MTEPSVTQDTDTLTRRRRTLHAAGDDLFAYELQAGDRIAAGFLPSSLPADVIFVEVYDNPRGETWVFVAFREDGYGPSSDVFMANARVPLEALADDGMGYSRPADDPTPVSPARAPLHTGSVVEGDHLVIDRPSVTVYFSFGHGQTDPDTGENLLDKYVTIVGPSYTDCRAAMFASKYGQAWAFDYLAGSPSADEWIPQWTEHDRIVLDAT
jgi:hypothetical protein